MKFGGFQPFTLSDYPGTVAAIVFTNGCNFRCPFCHNGELVDGTCRTEIPEEEILAFLQERRGKLDGLVVTGGEPTIHPDLPDFLSKVRDMGYRIKLDTNGYKPEMLETILDQGLADYIAMDIKAPFARYDQVTGLSNIRAERLTRSAELISTSGLPHEFRTTRVERLLDSEALEEIPSQVPAGSPHKWQRFRPEKVLSNF